MVRKAGETAAELKRSDTDAKGIREQLRDELRKAESENRHLRDR